VRAEALAQGRVEEVGRRVVAHRRVARRAIDDRFDPVSRLRDGTAHLDGLIVPDPVHVDDRRLGLVPANRARVRDLAPALGVERALLQLQQRPAVRIPRGRDARRRAQRLVPDEPGLRSVGHERDHLRMAVRGDRLGAGPGALPLLLHQRLEPGVVDRQTLLGEKLLREVVRKAVGVVELERIGRVDPRRPPRLRVRDQLAEQVGTAIERAPEALLLVGDPAQDRVALLREVRVDAGHRLDHALREAPQVRRLQLEHPALLDRSAHDPAQDVAAVLVRGHDPVGEQVRRPARVVGDDPHRARGLRVLIVGATRELLREPDERAEEI
jgi:hypothetical protein